jgi:hypothetical protein
MTRWKTKVKEPSFRQALIDNMRLHPEWDPIVFPQKYQPKLNTAARAGLPPKP